MSTTVSRRSWACNDGAIFAIKVEAQPLLKVTLPNIVADNLLILKKMNVSLVRI
jgi:hypothetical protein